MDRRFWNVLAANAASNLGDGLYQFALPLLALGLTRSPTLIAGVTLALTLAWLVFGLHAGSLVDRLDRRHVLVTVSVLRAGVLASITALVLADALTIPVVYLAAFVLGIGETLADTSLSALVPSVVSADRLESANGRIAAGQTVMNSFVGPPLGGALIAAGAGVVTAVATGLFGLTALALALVRGTFHAQVGGPPIGPAPEPVGRRVTEGLRFMWRSSVLRRLTLFTAAMNIWWAVWTAVFVVYAVAPGPMGLDPVGLGLLVTAMSLGGLVGSLAAGRLRRAVGIRNALLFDLVGTILLVGAPAITTSPVLIGAALTVAGFGGGSWVVLVSSIRQRLTPNALLGRVYSASRTISWGILPIGAALGGLGAELFGIQQLFALGAIASVVTLILFLWFVWRDGLEGA